MTKFLIRNDDLAFDTPIEEIKRFCEVCDKHGFRIIQSITPIGAGGRYARASMTNDSIKLLSFRRFEENKEVLEFLKERSDFIGVHGLWHTHAPTEAEILKGKEMLQELGLNPTYFVPPFNEGEYPPEVAGLITCKLSLENGERLEDFLNDKTPNAPIMYLHSWRFNNNYFTLGQLDRCLARLTDISQENISTENNTKPIETDTEPIKIKKLIDKPASPFRFWYNDWIKNNAEGNVLDIGKSAYWDYGFPTLDINPKRHPTYLGNAEQMDFPDETFDTVLCNGMYEFVDNPQKMIDEALRVTKKGGKVIFGFVGKDYKPYKKPWRFFEGKERLPEHTRVDFDNEYYYLICQK